MNTINDLSAWQLFFQIVASGSISKAAEDLRMESSAVSRKINRLESDLGVSLFQRSGRSVVLTSAGATAYSKMSRIIFDANTLFSDLRKSSNSKPNVITIAGPIGISEKIIPLLLTDYAKLNPDVGFSVRAMSYFSLFSAETIQTHDLVFSMSPLSIPSCVTQLLGGIPHILTASKHFMEENNVEINSPADLNKYPMFSFYSRNRAKNIYLHKDSQFYPVNFDVTLRFNHPGSVKTAVKKHAGIGVYCPIYFYYNELDDGTIVHVLPDWSMPIQQVYLNWKQTDNPMITSFIEWVLSSFPELPRIIPANEKGYWLGDLSEESYF